MKRHLRRVSSATSSRESISKGGVSARASTVSDRAFTSTSPVASFGFTMSGARRATSPSIWMTNSLLSDSASLKAFSLRSGEKTTWTSPERSRRSTKISPPWSRRAFTQPESFTSAPSRSARSSPHECVR